MPNQPEGFAPNMMAKPTSQNASEPTEKSIRFFMQMFTAFFARVSPVSTMAKPACMRNTRKAATSVQTKSAWLCTSLMASALPSGVGAGSAAEPGAAAAGAVAGSPAEAAGPSDAGEGAS